jgi:hypothetical protein
MYIFPDLPFCPIRVNYITNLLYPGTIRHTSLYYFRILSSPLALLSERWAQIMHLILGYQIYYYIHRIKIQKLIYIIE